MSFAFNFNLDEQQGQQDESTHAILPSSQARPAKREALEEMIETLPTKISYSRIGIPTESGIPTSVYRRDLFDARFQMIHEDVDEQQSGQAIAGADTDLVPGVYEGGLKTWECSVDLAAVLADKVHDEPHLLRHGRVLELGCGTALPSLVIFAAALQAGTKGLTLQLCDFNGQVLRLVTLPNLILTWYHSSGTGLEQDEGELELSEDVIGAFKNMLADGEISLEFYSGSWEGLKSAGTLSAGIPHIVLTSETIYSMDTLPSLTSTLLEALQGSSTAEGPPLCLVAAKVLYFGVGGGVYAFERELQSRGARAKTIWNSGKGVARVVLQVTRESVM